MHFHNCIPLCLDGAQNTLQIVSLGTTFLKESSSSDNCSQCFLCIIPAPGTLILKKENMIMCSMSWRQKVQRYLI